MPRYSLPHAWCGPGVIAPLELGRAEPGEESTTISGLAIPGIPNLHSHAFQRVMGGLAERRELGRDDFWSWRETMYRYAQTVGPDELQAIAAQLYMEMLEQGYTEVCEFHYVHHQPGGEPYDQPAAMSLALIAAAKEVGIGLTLLPTLYMTGHFDGRALSDRQRRFGHRDVESYMRLLERLLVHEDATTRIGVAFHSLRAVPASALSEVQRVYADNRFASSIGARPLHVHIAEQTAEVDDCVAIRGAPPVRWLLDNADVDERWCLIHATHLRADELNDLAKSGATAGICPTTEANLGDGLFPLEEYLAAGGHLGIGSDSHVSTSPVEELRWLEYGQRLIKRQRIVSANEQGRAAEALLAQAIVAGPRVARPDLSGLWSESQASGRVDFLSLKTQAAELASANPDQWIECWLFNGNRSLVNDVVVNGQAVVSDGRHLRRDSIEQRYCRVAQSLREKT